MLHLTRRSLLQTEGITVCCLRNINDVSLKSIGRSKAPKNQKRADQPIERGKYSEDCELVEQSHPVTPRDTTAAANIKVFAKLFSKSGEKIGKLTNFVMGLPR